MKLYVIKSESNEDIEAVCDNVYDLEDAMETLMGEIDDVLYTETTDLIELLSVDLPEHIIAQLSAICR